MDKNRAARRRSNQSLAQRQRRDREWKRAKILLETPGIEHPKTLRGALTQAGKSLKLDKEAALERERRERADCKKRGLVSPAIQRRRAKARLQRLAKKSSHCQQSETRFTPKT